MRLNAAEKAQLPIYMEMPKGYCKECQTPLYDGRKVTCDACKAAHKKAASKRTYNKHNYMAQEKILAAIKELEDAMRMQEWMLAETKKRVIDLRAKIFDL